jgi:hypothetical protein
VPRWCDRSSRRDTSRSWQWKTCRRGGRRRRTEIQVLNRWEITHARLTRDQRERFLTRPQLFALVKLPRSRGDRSFRKPAGWPTRIEASDQVNSQRRNRPWAGGVTACVYGEHHGNIITAQGSFPAQNPYRTRARRRTSESPFNDVATHRQSLNPHDGFGPLRVPLLSTKYNGCLRLDTAPGRYVTNTHLIK